MIYFEMVMKILFGFISLRLILSASRESLVFYRKKKVPHVEAGDRDMCFSFQSELVLNELLYDGVYIGEYFFPFFYFLSVQEILILNQHFVIIIQTIFLSFYSIKEI